MSVSWTMGSRAAAILAAGLFVSGCFRHHTIEPGTWRLRIEPRKPASGSSGEKLENYAYKQPRDVEVTVEWGPSKKVENVTVQFRSKKDAELRVLKGTIEPEGSHANLPEEPAGSPEATGPAINLEGRDPDWDLRVWGHVHNPRSMSGNIFTRGRGLYTDRYFDGTWTMNKVSAES